MVRVIRSIRHWLPITRRSSRCLLLSSQGTGAGAFAPVRDIGAAKTYQLPVVPPGPSASSFGLAVFPAGDRPTAVPAPRAAILPDFSSVGRGDSFGIV